MKTGRRKTLYLVVFALGMLLLSGCTINITTEINEDGTGLFGEEIILTMDEVSTYGGTIGDRFCQDDLGLATEDLPPGASIRQEQDEDSVSCIITATFSSLEELREIYTDMDITVNSLSLEDGKFYYDVSLDMEGSSFLGLGFLWTVTMPGNVTETNATSQEGNVLTWDPPISGTFNAVATSSVGGLGSSTWWIIGISAFCCCLLVLVLVIVLVIVMMKRNKKKKAEANAPLSF